jgi:iron complex outermembrane receptor protein
MRSTTLRPRIRAARLLGGVCSAALAGLGASQAWSQPAPAGAVEEVVVTGTRIRGVEAVGSNIIASNREEIVASGAPTTTDLLKKTPQIFGLGASETATSAQNGAANVTRGVGINLRGVGSNATLLLWNGRRFPAAGTQGQFTDPAVIPTLALERVEVVPDGASAIYGSDAVAGVVNLILRKTFSGGESFARYGGADGYHDYSLGQVLGKTWSGGHVMAAIQYDYHTALQGQDRDFYTSNLLARGGSDFRANQCFPGNVVVGGVFYAIPSTGVTPATAGALTANTRNLCDNYRRQDILPEQERTSVVLSASQDVGDRVTVFADAYYSNREFKLRGQGVTAALTVPAANPFFVRPPGTTGAVTVNYDFGPSFGIPAVPGYALSYDVVGGANVKLWGDWKAELSGSYGRSADAVKRRNNLNTAAAATALARTDPATALNLFGATPLSQALVDELSNGLFIIKSNSNLTVWNAQADGSVFDAPGGRARLAVGAEYRKEQLKGILFSGSSVAPVTVASAISRDVKAVYGELFVPLVGADNAMPGIQKLNLSIAGRYEEYSDFGNTSNPKVGLTWQPVEDLELRASYGRSFRAASLGEVDPHSSGFGLYGDTLPGPSGNQFGIGIAGGNQDLKPETAKTWSVGGHWRPDFFAGFDADVSYFSIDYENQILALRGTPGLLTNPFYAPYVVMNPTPAQVAALLASGLPINTPINASQVTYISDGRRQNLGTTLVRGFDFSLSYRWETALGDFDAGFNGEYFTKYEQAAAPGATPVKVLGLINFPQQFRGRGDLGWRKDAWNAVAYVNLIDSYIQNTVTPARKISDYATIDLHLAYDLGEGTGVGLLKDTTLALDATNLFDTDPPFVNQAGGYDPQTINPVGRLVAVSLRKRW